MRSWKQYLTMFLIFISIQAAALLFAPVLLDLSFQAFDDPQDPVNPLLYILAMLLMTGAILLMIKYAKERFLRLLFTVAIFFTLYAVFLPLAMLVSGDAVVISVVPIGMAFVLTFFLYFRPEWYIIDLVGLIVATGATAILGTSLGIMPAMLMLSILAIYDAISVYRTKHMLTLAEGVMEMRLPVLFIIPESKKFKIEEMEKMDLKDRSKDGERGTMMMGVGDGVIPGILVVSAGVFLSSADGTFQYSVPALLVALGTLVGACIGFAVLMRLVATGRPQAGLPFLNGGAIIGYILSYIIVFGDMSFGLG
ncbi:MAG TPA: presenilin family intramembrane aspartyl protease PSH [Methanomassiliicoccales archaeon]|nr:presenilin family intramembrane aspartyl protease PSH [Methanomassiliicoccales archaeon]